MKRLLFLINFLCLIAPVLSAQVTTEPESPEADGEMIIYFDNAGTDLEDYTGAIYAHIGLTIDGKEWQNVIGEWGDNTTQPKLNKESDKVYSLEIKPSVVNFFSADINDNIDAVDVVFRSEDGGLQTKPDYKIELNSFRIIRSSPKNGEVVTMDAGDRLPIRAVANEKADWKLNVSGKEVDASSGITEYATTYTIDSDVEFVLTATSSKGKIRNIRFEAETKPDVKSKPLPAGMTQGINLNENKTKATLVLFAPGKEYVHVIGSFNEWEVSEDYAMYRDTENTGLFWIELTDLDPEITHTFQYRTSDGIKTADPFSTLVLSPYDDPDIPAKVYPNMPDYPEGQEFEVTVLEKENSDYDWKITDFQRPEKEDLIIYELLLRDFNADKTWESLIANFDYFKNLKINAIEILPVMEFEGNSSWGYNTAFHMALDKAYGNKESMKKFIDLAHENGIAIILDIAFNHVYGRSPLVRMWMDDEGSGYGPPNEKNPYLNTEPKHAYNVGYDLNHQSPATQYYVKRSVEYWMKEFKIDGFRWDLTKGFTNNCTDGDEECTNAYQADRVQILKEYADYQWEVDPEFYIIFEHLGVGGSHEEQIEWANYRVDEGKGIMLWDKWTDPFNQNTMGYQENSDFSNLHHQNHGYKALRNVAYAESHDEERLMFKNLQYGNEQGSYKVKDLKTALDRQKTMAAVLFLTPGPKMFWQFGELGYEYSINNCEDNTEDESCRTDPSPLPSEMGYMDDAERIGLYTAWADIIDLRLSNEVFKTSTYSIDSGDLLPVIHVWNDAVGDDELNYVVVIANFDVEPKNISPNFPFSGEWIELFDESLLEVAATDDSFSIELAPGEYKVYGNNPPEENPDKDPSDKAVLYPNPAKNHIRFSHTVEDMEVFDLSGRRVLFIDSRIEKQTPVEVGQLQRGIYIIKAKSNDGNLTFKLVKG